MEPVWFDRAECLGVEIFEKSLDLSLFDVVRESYTSKHANGDFKQACIGVNLDSGWGDVAPQVGYGQSAATSWIFDELGHLVGSHMAKDSLVRHCHVFKYEGHLPKDR